MNRTGHLIASTALALMLGWAARAASVSPPVGVARAAVAAQSTAAPQMQTVEFRCNDTSACPKNVRDNGNWEFPIFVPLGACGDNRAVDVDVGLHILHSWRSDIAVRLAPAGWVGAPLEMFANIDFQYDNFGASDPDAPRDRYLWLNDEARENLDRSPCITGAREDDCRGEFYTPRRVLRGAYNRIANGTWVLRVEDGAFEDAADVRNWILRLTCRVPTPTPTNSVTPTGLATPTPTATPIVTRTATREPSLTARSPATRTSTVTPTRTPTRTLTPTAIPRPLYLPLVVRDRGCPPQDIFTDVILLLDASTTMGEPTHPGGPLKIDAAIVAARVFIEGFLQSNRLDRVGIVLFNQEAYVQEALTDRKDWLLETLDQRTRILNFQSRLNVGLAAAVGELTGPHAKPGHLKAIVMLTDGLVNPDSPEAVREQARQAESLGIQRFVIGYGDHLDAALLHDISSLQRTDSRYYYEAASDGDITAIYRRLIITVPCPSFVYWPYREEESHHLMPARDWSATRGWLARREGD